MLKPPLCKHLPKLLEWRRSERCTAPRSGRLELGVRPVSVLQRLFQRHPALLSWALLAIAMVAILLYTSRDVGLLPSQLTALVAATIALAGACVWIITWE
jgi:hypothetical protein